MVLRGPGNRDHSARLALPPIGRLCTGAYGAQQFRLGMGIQRGQLPIWCPRDGAGFLQNMVGTWQQFMSQSAPEMQGIEPAINLLSLHDLVDMMQKESEIDFRSVVLVPPVPESAPGQPSAAGGAPTAAAGANPMGGATLGDI